MRYKGDYQASISLGASLDTEIKSAIDSSAGFAVDHLRERLRQEPAYAKQDFRDQIEPYLRCMRDRLPSHTHKYGIKHIITRMMNVLLQNKLETLLATKGDCIEGKDAKAVSKALSQPFSCMVIEYTSVLQGIGHTLGIEQVLSMWEQAYREIMQSEAPTAYIQELRRELRLYRTLFLEEYAPAKKERSEKRRERFTKFMEEHSKQK